MSGIAHWALLGATRLLEQGKFSESIVHDRLMAKWRISRNSLEMFIHECCTLSPEARVRRSTFYAAYREWCGDVGKKRFSKARVKDLIEHSIGLGLSLGNLNGNETIYGIEVKTEEFTAV